MNSDLGPIENAVFGEVLFADLLVDHPARGIEKLVVDSPLGNDVIGEHPDEAATPERQENAGEHGLAHTAKRGRTGAPVSAFLPVVTKTARQCRELRARSWIL